MSIETLRPNAAGDECNIKSQLGAACPNHYQNVDEVEWDGDVTVVQSNAVDWERDFYNITNHSVGSGIVNHITVYALARYSGKRNQNSLKLAIKSGTGSGVPDTPSESSERTVSGVYVPYSNQWNTNPATGSAFTWDEVDRLQIGVVLRRSQPQYYWTLCTQVYVEVDYGAGVVKLLSGTLSGIGTLIGNVKRNRIISGQLSGSGVLTGTIKRIRSLSGELIGAGGLAGSIKRTRLLAGVLYSVGLLAGNLQKISGGIKYLSGILSGTGALAGNLKRARALSGSIGGSGTLTGLIKRIGVLSGSISGVGTLAGSISRIKLLTGTLSGIGQLTVSLKRIRILSGIVSGVGSLAGILRITKSRILSLDEGRFKKDLDLSQGSFKRGLDLSEGRFKKGLDLSEGGFRGG